MKIFLKTSLFCIEAKLFQKSKVFYRFKTNSKKTGGKIISRGQDYITYSFPLGACYSSFFSVVRIESFLNLDKLSRALLTETFIFWIRGKQIISEGQNYSYPLFQILYNVWIEFFIKPDIVNSFSQLNTSSFKQRSGS